MSTNWLLNDLAEAKGKQELHTRQSPQVLKALREMALVQSVASSNRIEGVTVAADRLRPLVLGHARPKDRSEQEIAGYRSALNLIHTKADNLQITPYHVLQKSSHRWHDSKHDLLPWLNYFLAIARRAHGEFEQRAGQIKAPRGAKSALVLDAIQRQVGEFSVGDLQRECPAVGLDMIRHLLDRLRKERKVKCLGTGRSARWKKAGN
jgi:hypothetical protein